MFYRLFDSVKKALNTAKVRVCNYPDDYYGDQVCVCRDKV